ncbi:eCIS core domain-containing protein [Nocardia altamirensis]|uniref:eCIS core domain-containing protein n=1 Tax=Nocardia altamirensis TaxID=472158 RepID=UPI000B1E50B1|nr:DUF4157 domain-containing protein [Nocardia altamirensis]
MNVSTWLNRENSIARGRPDSDHSASAARQTASPTVGIDLTAVPAVAPPIVRDVLRDAGQPLDGATLAAMNSQFDTDFSRVRIHTGPQASASAAAVAAQAYTVGRHVVFDARGYRPGTEDGRQLLTHELAHVVQQSARDPSDGATLRIGDTDAPVEAAAAGAAAGGRHSLGTDHGPVLRRQPVQMSMGDTGISTSTTQKTLSGFATGSAELTDAHQEIIARVAADLNAHPLIFGGFVTLVGQADRRGDAGENKALGQRRAEAVRDRLRQLVTDNDTAQQIGAYSLGAPTEGPVRDEPMLRKVDITVTRRMYNMDTPAVQLTRPNQVTPPNQLARPKQTGPQLHLDVDLMRTPRPPGIKEKDWPWDAEGWRKVAILPEWFWKALPPRPQDPEVLMRLLTELVTEVDKLVQTQDLANGLARIAAEVASGLGIGHRAEVHQLLMDAYKDGKEAGVKELLKAMIEAAAGSPTGAQESPYGPPTEGPPVPKAYETPEFKIP